MGYLNIYNSVLNAYYSSIQRQTYVQNVGSFPGSPTDFKHLDTEATLMPLDLHHVIAMVLQSEDSIGPSPLPGPVWACLHVLRLVTPMCSVS